MTHRGNAFAAVILTSLIVLVAGGEARLASTHATVQETSLTDNAGAYKTAVGAYPMAPSYAQDDLVGRWVFKNLWIDSPASGDSWSGYDTGVGTLDSSGCGSFTVTGAGNNGTIDSVTQLLCATLDAQGTVTLSVPPGVTGVLSADKNMIVFNGLEPADYNDDATFGTMTRLAPSPPTPTATPTLTPSPSPTVTPTSLPSSVLPSAIAATDTCIPVSDTSIFSPTGGYAYIGNELISYSGIGAACGSGAADSAAAGTAGALLGVARNLNGLPEADLMHPAGTLVTPGPTAPPCVGDCNNDHSVTVGEILTLINIAVGNAEISACEIGDANQDGQITVDEILTSVNYALNGCPAQ
jgi:hypothetical protein